MIEDLEHTIQQQKIQFDSVQNNSSINYLSMIQLREQTIVYFL